MTPKLCLSLALQCNVLVFITTVCKYRQYVQATFPFIPLLHETNISIAFAILVRLHMEKHPYVITKANGHSPTTERSKRKIRTHMMRRLLRRRGWYERKSARALYTKLSVDCGLCIPTHLNQSIS